MVRPHVLSGGRYPVLRALAILYLIGAALTALGGIIAAIYVLASFPWGGWLDRTFLAIGALVGTFYFVITMLAVAEILKLAIDVEHNTRMAVPGRIGMPASLGVIAPEPMPTAAARSSDGGRLADLDEETAEAALLRGH